MAQIVVCLDVCLISDQECVTMDEREGSGRGGCI
jgi:hypothetical protein